MIYGLGFRVEYHVGVGYAGHVHLGKMRRAKNKSAHRATKGFSVSSNPRDSRWLVVGPGRAGLVAS